MNEISNDERRDYYRINDTVGFSCSICKSEKEIPTLEEFLAEIPDEFQLINYLNRIDIDNASLLHTIQEVSPDISRYLKIINAKIDALSRHMVTVGSMEEIKFEKITLSAGGLSLINDENIALGTILRTRMVLYPSCSGILTYGKVVRSFAIPNTEPAQYDTALQYVLIKESDRDVLVRHVLQLQSNQLRQKK